MLLLLAPWAAAQEPATLAWKLSPGDEFEFHLANLAVIGTGESELIMKRDFRGTVKVDQPGTNGATRLLLTFVTLDGSNKDNKGEKRLSEEQRNVGDITFRIRVNAAGRWQFDPSDFAEYEPLKGHYDTFQNLFPEIPPGPVKPGGSWSSTASGQNNTWTLVERKTAGGADLATISGKRKDGEGKYEVNGTSAATFDAKAGYFLRSEVNHSFNIMWATKVNRMVELNKK